MNKVRILILAITITLISGPIGTTQSFSQEQVSPEALQAAQGLVALISPSIATVTEQMAQVSWPAIEKDFRTKFPNISADAVNALRAEVQHIETAVVNEKLLNEAPAIYARYFTADEIRQLIAFYQTPAGAKALQVMPVISAEFTAVSAQLLPVVQQQINAAMNAILRVYGYNR